MEQSRCTGSSVQRDGTGTWTKTGIYQNVYRLFVIYGDQREGRAMGLQKPFQFDRLLSEAHSRAHASSLHA